MAMGSHTHPRLPGCRGHPSGLGTRPRTERCPLNSPKAPRGRALPTGVRGGSREPASPSAHPSCWAGFPSGTWSDRERSPDAASSVPSRVTRPGPLRARVSQEPQSGRREGGCVSEAAWQEQGDFTGRGGARGSAVTWTPVHPAAEPGPGSTQLRGVGEAQVKSFATLGLGLSPRCLQGGLEGEQEKRRAAPVQCLEGADVASRPIT